MSETKDLSARLARLAALPPTEPARGMIGSYITACADAAAEIARLRVVLEAARCIRHWHDRMIGQDEGMVVSAEHVRLLWKAIEEYDATTKVAGPP